MQSLMMMYQSLMIYILKKNKTINIENDDAKLPLSVETLAYDLYYENNQLPDMDLLLDLQKKMNHKDHENIKSNENQLQLYKQIIQESNS